MTVSMDDLIANEERPRVKCRVCDLLATLPHDEADRWEAWARKADRQGKFITSATAAARVLSARTQVRVSHSPIEKHVAEKHGASA